MNDALRSLKGTLLGPLKGRQGAGAGSLYVAGSFAVSGVLTYVFHGLSTRFLGQAGYGDFVVLWSAVFLVVQVVWVGVTQTLGRYIAERSARGEDFRPVISSTKRLTAALLGAFLVVSLLASPLLARGIFNGSWLLTLAFVAAVVAYAPEYFRRGTFGGHRQFARLGALHIAESSSRALIAAILLFAGAGVAGPAAAVVLAPLAGVLVVRPTPEATVEAPPQYEGEPFSAVEAFRFAGPVLLCVTIAQVLMNGGPILVSLLGGTRAEVGVFGAALILARIPQYVISPAIAALLPHASRALAVEGTGAFDRFVVRAAGVVGVIGVLMVAGVWALGEWALALFAPDFEAGRGVLVLLAALAAFYIMSETLNQALFALGRARLAALGWFAGLPVCTIYLVLSGGDLLNRVSLALALGALAATVAQAAFCLAARHGRFAPRE